MFGSLSDSLVTVLDKLRGKGVLTENDINSAMRDIRVALIEADVALPAIKQIIERIKTKALGIEVINSITPGQMIVKIVHDELIEMLSSDDSELQINYPAPVVILVAGLQGAGKTTTAAKLGLKLRQKHKKKVLMASTDTRRPAAQKQLEVLGKQVGIDTLSIIDGQSAIAITERAMKEALIGNFDILIVDTAGRMHIDEDLMTELQDIYNACNPKEVLLVADSMIGQDAVNMAKSFTDKVKLTGIVLTKIDGDTRGGAALSMKSITGLPIKLLGTGEKLSELEDFKAESIASRILAMGDIVSLVERMHDVVNVQEAEHMAKKMQKGAFDLNDMLSQLKNMKKMGGIGSLMGMLPGLGSLKASADQIQHGEKMFSRQSAIIQSMTHKERTNPKIINPSRKHRIANGSGTSVPEVNRLLKQHLDMCGMMKKFGKMDESSMKKLGSKLIGGGF